jgi:hypothetical protein
MALLIEIEGSILGKQAAQRSCYLTKVLDESSVEPNMA